MANEPRFSPDLRERLVELFGPDGALELMEPVPQVPWHEIATKSDVADMATKADVAAVKADVDGLRGDVVSIKLELAEFRAEMANQLRELSFRMTTTMVTTMLGGIFGAAGLAFAAARLS